MTDPPTIRPTPAVEARNFTARRGDALLLSDIDFVAMPGKITAVIGPEGSGKSVFLRCVNRLLELEGPVKTSGVMEVLGEDAYGPKIDVLALRRRVGMVFNKAVLPVQSVFDNVAIGLRMAGVTGKSQLAGAVETCLQRVGLWQKLNLKLHESANALPPEQQQRLCIARVLATGPSLILMDEPTKDLDFPAAGHMEDLICDLAKDHTVVLAARTPQQASHVADTTAFFLGGKLIESGPTETLLMNPKCRETEAYVSGRYA